jgi:hypothetical protein
MLTPHSFSSGDSAAWTERLYDYPASAGWSLLLRFLWPGHDAVEVTADADGDDFAVTLTPDDTADWPAGQAVIVRVVSRPGESKTLPPVDIVIFPNLRLAVRHDPRSLAQQALDALREALFKFAQGGQWKTQAYSIAGRSMTFRSTDEIIKLIRYYEQQVAAETAARTGGSQRIQARF